MDADKNTKTCPDCAKKDGEIERLKAEMLKIPLTMRATGRTIPDLTGREHVCEWQRQVLPKAPSPDGAEGGKP